MREERERRETRERLRVCVRLQVSTVVSFSCEEGCTESQHTGLCFPKGEAPSAAPLTRRTHHYPVSCAASSQDPEHSLSSTETNDGVVSVPIAWPPVRSPLCSALPNLITSDLIRRPRHRTLRRESASALSHLFHSVTSLNKWYHCALTLILRVGNELWGSACSARLIPHNQTSCEEPITSPLTLLLGWCNWHRPSTSNGRASSPIPSRFRGREKTKRRMPKPQGQGNEPRREGQRTRHS